MKRKKNNIEEGIMSLLYIFSKKYFLITFICTIYIFIFIFEKNFALNINSYLFKKKLKAEITKIFNKTGKININEIENNLLDNRNNKNVKFNSFHRKCRNVKNIINVGFTLDPEYILETMLTVTSIMKTQNNTTEIVFHFGVTNNFTADNMLKMYELKRKINNLTEFNFYYLKGAIKKMQNFHIKGVACPGKFELPELLPDNVKKLLLFDAGDVLVFRDLTELYCYDIKDYWVLGTPEPQCIYAHNKIGYNLTKYLNIGSLLLNVEKLKQNKFWNIYTSKRNLRTKGPPDQSLFNILVPDNKKDYFPFRFGGLTPFNEDRNSDKLEYHNYGFRKWLNSSFSSSFPENPKSLDRLTAQLYNPAFIHQWNGKWHEGKGLSIYRNLAKYFIKLAGIWDELCSIKPGFCI
jgi:hypothetical protein